MAYDFEMKRKELILITSCIWTSAIPQEQQMRDGICDWHNTAAMERTFFFFESHFYFAGITKRYRAGDHTLPAELAYHTIGVRPRTCCCALMY
jgi:hypothetical protein